MAIVIYGCEWKRKGGEGSQANAEQLELLRVIIIATRGERVS